MAQRIANSINESLARGNDKKFIQENEGACREFVLNSNIWSAIKKSTPSKSTTSSTKEEEKMTSPAFFYCKSLAS